MPAAMDADIYPSGYAILETRSSASFARPVYISSVQGAAILGRKMTVEKVVIRMIVYEPPIFLGMARQFETFRSYYIRSRKKRIRRHFWFG